MKTDNNKKQNKGKEELYTIDELICFINWFRNSKQYKNTPKKPNPKFVLDEIIFIIQTIFYKPYKDLPLVLIDFITNHYLSGIKLTNSATFRRIEFLKNFVLYTGNSAKAAIASGYSPKSAKQQGYRTLKWLQDENLGRHEKKYEESKR